MTMHQVLFTLIALAASASGNHAAEPQQLTSMPGDEVNPAYSPDGSQIAFGANPDGSYDIYLYSVSDGRIRALTDTPGSEGRPSFSPDGNQIVYQSDAGGRCCHLRLMKLDSGENHVLLETEHYVGSPDWSPNGEHVVFMSDAAGSMDIYVYAFETGDVRRVSDNPGGEWHARWVDDARVVFYVTWGAEQTAVWTLEIESGELEKIGDHPIQAYRPNASRDGRYITYVADTDSKSDLWLTDLRDNSQRRLTPARFDVDWPEFSADGKQLVFSGRDINYRLFRLKLSSGKITAMTNPDSDASEPVVSRDGKNIVYVSDVNGNEGDVLVIPSAGGKPEVRNPNEKLQDNPAWSPNGKELVYLYSTTGDYAGRKIRVMDSAGNNERELLDYGDIALVEWCAPNTIVFSRYESWQRPVELWRVDPDGTKARKLLGDAAHYFVEDCIAETNEALVIKQQDDLLTLLAVSLQDGTTKVLYTMPPGSSNPRISPGGTRISFISSHEGQADIYLLTLGTGDTQRVTNTAYSEASPDWIDNDTLVFEANIGNRDIWMVTTEGD